MTFQQGVCRKGGIPLVVAAVWLVVFGILSILDQGRCWVSLVVLIQWGRLPFLVGHARARRLLVGRVGHRGRLWGVHIVNRRCD